MNKEGLLTVPTSLRRQLELAGETQFAVTVVEQGLLFQPVVTVPLEDAWAYTEKHRRLVEHGLEDIETGRVHRLSEDDLIRLSEKANAQSD